MSSLAALTSSRVGGVCAQPVFSMASSVPGITSLTSAVTFETGRGVCEAWCEGRGVCEGRGRRHLRDVRVRALRLEEVGLHVVGERLLGVEDVDAAAHLLLLVVDEVLVAQAGHAGPDLRQAAVGERGLEGVDVWHVGVGGVVHLERDVQQLRLLHVGSGGRRHSVRGALFCLL